MNTRIANENWTTSKDFLNTREPLELSIFPFTARLILTVLNTKAGYNPASKPTATNKPIKKHRWYQLNCQKGCSDD